MKIKFIWLNDILYYSKFLKTYQFIQLNIPMGVIWQETELNWILPSYKLGIGRLMDSGAWSPPQIVNLM